MLHKSFLPAVLAALVMGPYGAMAQELEPAAEVTNKPSRVKIEISNLTANQPLSPPAIVVHRSNFKLYELGMPASEALYKIAEDGETGAIKALEERADVHSVTMAEGAIPPGQMGAVTVYVPAGYQVSLVTMLVTTNDAFTGAKNLMIPRAGYYRDHHSVAYDAGSEANTEVCAHIPGPPCGNPGVRMEEGAEGFVHVHRGIQGVGDLPAGQFDWRNPVSYIKYYQVR